VGASFANDEKKQYAVAQNTRPSQRSLFGIPWITPTTTPPPSSTPWLPQCTTVNVGSGYILLSQPSPASTPVSSSSSDVINAGMTGAEWVHSTGFDASRLIPTPLPIAIEGGGGNVTDASVCSSNVAYSAGPTASPTTCSLVSCFASGDCSLCSGTFVADPAGSGRLLFMTATHCVARSASDTLLLSKSFVSCNRDAGLDPPQGDGIFEPTAVAMSRVDFNVGSGLTDGSLIHLRALSNTNLAFAKPVAVGAVTSAGLAQSVPIYSAGFPQVDPRFAGCTESNLGNVNAIHYSRRTTVRTLTNNGIQIPNLSACNGNSGGTMMDEQACVLFGVLSASATSCLPIIGTSFNLYSRIVASAAENGVPFLSLAAGLVAGQVAFVN